MKDDLAYVEHILDCIRKIKKYTINLSAYLKNIFIL